MTHHPSAASLRLHGARLLFPPVATLLFLVLTEYIARGTLSKDTFVQYIFPHAEAYLLAWGLLFLVWMAVDWLTRFAPLATLLSALLGCLPATVDFYTLQLRGEPFLPWDLMQVSEAAGVASAAGIHVQKSMVVSGVVVLALTVGSFFLYRGRQKLPWVQRLAGFGASTAAACALIFGVFLQPAVTQSLGILPDAWMQDRYYRYYGVITSFLTNLTNLEIDKPEDYSEEAVNAILDDVEAGGKYTTGPVWPGSYAAQTPADEQVKQPTILYVMDESYWDVSELEQYGFRFDTDVSANLHALQQTSAYGRVYSPSFGGGTCDVEFEALTGYSVSYLPSGSKPYQQHVTRPMFALPSYLKTEGYQTAAVHCFWARYWSRDTAYPNLGLDDFISLEKMQGVQKVRRHYWTTGLVTDDSMADQIIGQYETMKAQSDAPVFLHAVTMQNHTNYNKDNYPDDQRVKVTEAPAGLKASTVGALEDFCHRHPGRRRHAGQADGLLLPGGRAGHPRVLGRPLQPHRLGLRHLHPQRLCQRLQRRPPPSSDHPAHLVELLRPGGGPRHHRRLRHLAGDDGAVRPPSARLLPVPWPSAPGSLPGQHPRHHSGEGRHRLERADPFAAEVER